MIQAVVFDMDGVIFDLETLLTDCWVDATRADGIPDVAHANYLCLGVNDAETKEKFLEVYGPNFPYDMYEKEVFRLFRERACGGQLPKKEGVEELLSFLKESGIKVALATSSRESIVMEEITEGGLLPYFDAIICGDTITRSKPDPEIYLKACGRLGVRPEDAYAVEDSFNGVRSATRAGLTCIMVPDIKQPDDEMRSLACCILPSLLDVKAYLSEKMQEKCS